MKILIITQYFWPENFGINSLVQGLVEKGHQLTVLTGRPNYPRGKLFKDYGIIFPWREKYKGASVVRVPLVPRGRGGPLRLAINFLSFAISASILGPLLIHKKYDAILVYEPSPITVGIPSMVVKAITRSPVHFWLQDLWPESLSATGSVSSPAILNVVELMVRFIYKTCDRILIQSQAFAPAVVRLGGDPKKIRYFPNSAEPLYRPVTVPANAPEKALLPEGFRVTFAGNIGAAQDFGTIINAARLLKHEKDIQWVIIGDGRMKNRVERLIQEYDLTDSVHLIGRHPPERMPYFFALSDVLLTTLRKDPIFALTIPSKVQSYLACGRPIVAALDGEGARVIEEARAGVTCPAQDPDKLAEAVLAVYNLSASEKEAMGRNGRLIFERDFERSILLERLEGWMVELTPKKAGK